MTAARVDLTEGKILLLRQGGIGDALVGVPLARALRRKLPEARIDVLLSRRNAVIGRAFAPYTNRVIRYSKRPLETVALFAKLWATRYDAVVDLIDIPSSTSRLFLTLTAAPVRVGIAGSGRSPYTHPVPSLNYEGMHVLDRIGQLLTPFGIEPAAVPLDLEYPISAQDAAAARDRLGPPPPGPRVGINLAGSGPAKYWGRTNFIRFIHRLRAAYPGVQAVVFSPPAYAPEATAIVRESAGPIDDPAARVVAAPVVESFHDFAAMLHECDVIVTPDTSVSHLAAAWKRPSVVLFIQTHREATLWRPYRSPCRVLAHPSAVAEIPVSEVTAAFLDLMVSHPAAGPREPVCT